MERDGEVMFICSWDRIRVAAGSLTHNIKNRFRSSASLSSVASAAIARHVVYATFSDTTFGGCRAAMPRKLATAVSGCFPGISSCVGGSF
jgi:hypothetical protein